MILILVPLVCALVGGVLYLAMRATGAFGVYSGSPASSASTRSATSYSYGSGNWSSSPSTWRERISEIPSGWLIGIIAVCGVWIVAWLVVLAVGLNVLT